MTKQIKTKTIVRTFVALPFALSTLSQAIAQESNLTKEKSNGIDIIEVTSEKRVSTLQETPIAISAFNADELARQDIEEANDIQFAIPNAMFTDRGTFNIRGVGNSAISATAESGTGLHVNGIYLTVPSTSNEYYDLQTIEVLRGPQGTLYGRNTTAGVVNIITQRPTDMLEGYLSVELGNYNSVRTVGALNLPLTDNINQRFAFNTVSRDGFTQNIATGNDIDGRDQFSVRSTTHFQIEDELDVTLFAQYYGEDSNRSNRRGVRCISDPILGCSSEVVGFEFVNSDYLDGNLKNFLGPAAAIVRPDFYNTNPDGSTKINPNDPRKVNLDNEPIAIADELILSLEVNYEIESGVFTSVTAFHDRATSGQRDYDNANGSNAFLIPVDYVFNDEITLQGTQDFEPVQVLNSTSEQYSQELRFVSNLKSDLNYTVGAYWLNYKAESRVATFNPYLSLIGASLGLPTEYHDFDTRTPEIETTSWAVFGESYYKITDQLTLTTGLRYSNEDKHQTTQTVTPFSFLTPGFNPMTFESLDNDWQETTGKVGLSYNMQSTQTDETLIFSTAARGYKAGGLNPGGASKTNFNAEYINAFEFGTKNTLFDRRLQANATVFMYDYLDIQLGALEQNGTGAAITDNTDAEVSGLEMEFIALPIPDLMVNLNVSLLDTKVTGEFSTPDGSQPRSVGVVNVKGNELPYAPNKSIQFGIQYVHDLSDNWLVTYRAQNYWQDNFYARVYNTATDKIASWNQTDLSASLSQKSGSWELEAFVKNLNNKDSMTGLTVENSLAGRFRLPAILDPKQYGVRVTYRFE